MDDSAKKARIEDRLKKLDSQSEATRAKLEEAIKKIDEQHKQKIEKVSLFANKLSQLRKEREISQKKAAEDLGISQALLSHYEKGIRECGLDFVIRCSQYYNVTSDYLLGISDNRNGIDFQSFDKVASSDQNPISTATKTLLEISRSASQTMPSKYVEDYFTLCIYRGALTLAKAGVLPKELFKFDYSLGRELASAAIALHDAKFVFIEDKSRTGEDFDDVSSLNKLIENAEENILKNLVIDDLF